ncbi:BRCT domain-containing protein [Aeromonas hydrophila]|uniref:BRCT domain-containing protein n=1 Tax=Aeromonas hydrophila TaxID=644 RepID=UPI00090C274F|nr:BRCT domain-containing protein [Aeromonas hydrophila]APJ15123.1 NAD-dependent DNA ligase [Aeromonas hydrophila]
MTTLDRNGQPLANYNANRNRDKLLNNLMGILDGIVADGVIDEQEVLYLDTWLKECAGRRDWVLRELSNLVSDVLADGVITEDEKLHLMSTIPQFMESLRHIPGVDFYSEESDKLLLEGLCKGVAGDQHLSDAEIRYMKWWMTQNSLLRAHYPGKQLYQTVERILKDGVITEDERDELHQQVLLFVGNPFEHGAVDGMATRLAVSDLDIDNLAGCGVCFTGAFLSGTRNQCQETALGLGAIPHNTVTKEVDYLIIGELCSRDWRFSSYGRKIEKAMKQQEKGHHIKIVTEEAWLDYAREVTDAVLAR